jgi:hypothetical protein|tara:strand:- start:384 stop:524 length:141 start_codon:yes stop_codon:yes gene_type:complete
MPSSEKKEEPKKLHFKRPLTIEEAFWEDRCGDNGDPSAPECLIYCD